MKRIFVLIMFCGLIALSQADLAITGGDFNDGTSGGLDILNWYDSDTVGAGAWWNTASYTAGPEPFPTQSAFLGDSWPAEGGGRWMYQEIGTKANNTIYSISFDFAQPTDGNTGRTVGVQIDIYAGDYPEAAQDVDIADAGLTLIDTLITPTTSEVGYEVFTHYEAELNLDAASLSDTLWIRLTNFGGETTVDAWLCIDNIEILSESAVRPYDPQVTPVDSEGAVGNVVKVGEVFEIHDVVLSWKAGPDANALFPVNPDLLSSNIYLQTGAPDDPNLYLYDSVPQVDYDDPSLSYALPNDLLTQGTTYEWRIEQVMDNGSGGYPAGDPNNIWGNVWSFTTASAIPTVLAGPEHTLTDLAGDATLEITTGLVTDSVEWYEVVGEQDSDENGETDDILLTDSGIYSGTNTKILTITGAASDGSDDTRVYAIPYNGTTPADQPSQVAWFWYPRLVNTYEFESTYTADSNSFTPDSISGYDAQLMSADAGDDVPSLEPNVPSAPGLTSTTSLNFDNLITNDPNNYGAQYAQVNNEWAGAYADITISAWIYWKGGGNWQRIYDFGNDAGLSTFICPNPNSGGALRFAVDTSVGAEQNITAPGGTLPEDEWTHIAATLSGDTAKLYVNGEWIVTDDITINPIDNGSTTQNWIGRSQYGADAYFSGLMDNVKVWNYGLTNAEVADDYLSDTEEAFVCDTENEDLGDYDSDDDCKLTIVDFSSFAARWLEDDRLYPLP